MRFHPSLLWSWNKSVDRVTYLLSGIVLVVIKYAIDWTVAELAFQRFWSPLNYLVWPNGSSLKIFELTDDEQLFSLVMLGIALPFIWAGLILTVHRLRDARLPVALVALFFVPVVNLLLFLVLVLVPTRVGVAEELPVEPAPLRRLREKHRQVTGAGAFASAAISLAISVPATVGLLVLGATVLKSYGFGVFVGAPFVLGLMSAALLGLSRPQSFGACLLIAVLATTLVGVAVLAIAVEGFICLLMAAPIAYPLATVGALVGFFIQARPWAASQSPFMLLALLVTLPGIMAAESAYEPELTVREVRTEVEIAAPPERVWDNVVSFPALSEPNDWLFRAGVAYPTQAEIRGQGVGAVRHCHFSTGTFVEPIEVWQPPHRLRFGVTEQPPPMREWSPYEIHPAHLDHYLISQRGEFRLEPLPNGHTRLIGTTWYTNRMWPAAYWFQWSDLIIRKIHRRVLEHIKELSE